MWWYLRWISIVWRMSCMLLPSGYSSSSAWSSNWAFSRSFKTYPHESVPLLRVWRWKWKWNTANTNVRRCKRPCASLLATCSSTFYYPNNNRRPLYIAYSTSYNILNWSLAPSLLDPNVYLICMILNTCGFYSSLRVRNHVSHLYKIAANIIIFIV